ncbi:SusC/RagA family TonB-linked outer membrane protein [Bacteroides oleiciplenus]|uniref:TonB-dependent receptor n=1 Tax=Bacteroides oleiciplenus TaxID=626931 RepID=A0A3E5B1U8_9BACE|nr:TonB-dependent receptor [Bacteroides oleiciplenus]RGN31512.1 TonB-dependent receptor [Bacteroides oleiciplenus]
MRLIFYGNKRSLMAIIICVALLTGSRMTYAVNEHASVYSTQQTGKIKGTVIDVNGEPVIGASVVLKGTSNGTITDIDGNFTLSDIPSNGMIQVSFIGYKTLEVQVKGQNSFSLTLLEDTETLDEVVVVGYGTMKKSDLTGAVGSISSEKLAARGTTRLEDALQGAVPGVDITQSNSRAGGGFNIQIRGQASINKQASPLYVIDGVVSESMDFLNPEDIERVDVLKDASSTAIYGSRASAGVVMITTKGSKGASKVQKMSVSYDGYYGIRKIARMPDLMDAEEFIDYRFARFTTLETTKYDGSGRAGIDANGVPHYTITKANQETAFMKRIGGADYRDSKVYEMMMAGESYDWTDLVTRTAAQQNHFISMDGSTEKATYRLGFGYQNEENVFLYNDYSRFNIKGSYDAKLSKVLEAGLSVNMAYSIKEDFQTNSSYSPYETAFLFNPFISPYDENGKILLQPASNAPFETTAGFTSTISPLIDLADKNYTDETKKYNVLTSFYLRANIMENMKFTTTFSPNFQYSRQGIFNATGLNDNNKEGSSYYFSTGMNSAQVETKQRLNWTWDSQLDYNKTIGNHSFSGMGLFSMYRSQLEAYKMKGFNIPNDKLSFHALEKAASSDKTIESSYTESTMVSGAFRVNYSYKGRYMATATVRADGSSRFAEGNRWGWFPSAALAWRMSEEAFLKDTKWLDNLKLRLSYGVTGNNNVSDYVTHYSASGPNYVVLDGTEVQAYYPNGLVNTALIWEKVKEFDFGVDLSILNSRINLTADIYNRLSDGQIMDRIVPLETGESKATFNVGSVRNRGIELGLQFGAIRNSEFSWDVNVNYSRNWNKIIELSNGKVDEVASNRFIGKPLNSLRDYTHTDIITDKGVTMKTKDGNIHYTLEELYAKYGSKYKWYEGQMAVNDWNNDGQITDEDKQIYGCTDPKWIGSLSTTLNYKNFDFSVMIYTKQGQWTRSYFHDKYMDVGRGQQKMAMDFYIPAGTPVIDHATGDIVLSTETKYGKYPYPNNSDTSAGGYYSSAGSAKGEGFQYQKASFVKVKNICLGYTFPKQWIAKAGMQHLRLYVNILNPFCFTDYEGFDPEWASAKLTDGGPASVTYQMGVNIKF